VPAPRPEPRLGSGPGAWTGKWLALVAALPEQRQVAAMQAGSPLRARGSFVVALVAALPEQRQVAAQAGSPLRVQESFVVARAVGRGRVARAPAVARMRRRQTPAPSRLSRPRHRAGPETQRKTIRESGLKTGALGPFEGNFNRNAFSQSIRNLAARLYRMFMRSTALLSTDSMLQFP
jgi:hypothetical protein